MCEMKREVKSHALCRVVGIAVSLHFVLILIVVALLPSTSKAQLAWSPIQVDSENSRVTHSRMNGNVRRQRIVKRIVHDYDIKKREERGGKVPTLSSSSADNVSTITNISAA